MFQGCSGVVLGCSGLFRGCTGDVPGCSGFYRHPAQSPIRVPRTPGWAGTFGSVTLSNTCPVDNFLTIVYLQLKDVPQTSVKLSGMSESWAKDLVTIERLFDQHEFSRGKVEWLRPFPQFDFTGASGTVDVWGNEFDLFWQRCASMLKSAPKSTCSSQQCPKKEDLLTATGINLAEISSQQVTETYIEAAIREWQLPAPTQCGKEFIIPPPPNTDAILGPPRIDISSGHMYQPFVCNGVRTFNQRTFVPEMPFALLFSESDRYFEDIAFASLKSPKLTQKHKSKHHGSTFRSFISFPSVLKLLNFDFSFANLINRHSHYECTPTTQTEDGKPVVQHKDRFKV